MSEHFQAVQLTQKDNATEFNLIQLTPEDLPAGEVLVAIDYSSLNFKDAMAVTGTGKIVRQFPMVPGIDFAGTVIESSASQYAPGDKVILTGWSVGERYWGGYSQQQRVKAEWLVTMPKNMDSLHAMTIGTAGLTAMLCVLALEEAGVKSGKVLVSGASGGVGSVAVRLLAQRGYEVIALSKNHDETKSYLKSLGAKEIIGGEEWTQKPAPLGSQRWDGAIDVVGGTVLARILSEIQYGGAVAACGLAGSATLETTVMPFILRGVRLIGVDSVMSPLARRTVAWKCLQQELPANKLKELQRIIPLKEIPTYAQEMMAGRARGRVVVDVNQ